MKYGAQFSIAALQTSIGWNTGPSAFIPDGSNMALTAGMDPGVNGADCPACDFAARASSNIDNDTSADVPWVSSQDHRGRIGRCIAMTVAPGDAYTPGLPAKVVDATCVD